MTMEEHGRLSSQNCFHSNRCTMLMLFGSVFSAINIAFAFSSRHAINSKLLGRQIKRISLRPTTIHPSEEAEQSHGHTRTILFSQPIHTIEDDAILTLQQKSNEKGEVDHEAPANFLSGSAEGYIVTKLYNVPLDGFPLESNGEDSRLSLSALFSPEDRIRLRLESSNVTLPAALMFLDPERYPTQSKARKAIRQRAICICRNHNNNNNNNASLTPKFDQIGKVIMRVYPGDAIGFQRRAGSDYYAMQGVPYRSPPFDVPVVYEDDHMAIVNKPAGVVMYRAESGQDGKARGGGHGRDTLLSALPYYLKPSKLAREESDEDDKPQNLMRPQPVHRLDRPVSGLVVVAKTRKATQHLSKQFELRKARKTYTAIVNGCPQQLTSNENESSSSYEWNTIDHDLDEKTAITEWRSIRKVKSLHGKDGQLTLVELKPKTGRYHQLRRHMAWVCSSPLVGDTTYDKADESALRLRSRGLFLCSNAVELEHPFYNTPAGREDWISLGQREIRHGDALLWEDDSTGTVKIKAKIELPQKFESFLRRENERVDKFASG
mmetsp:Transcript_4354/g.9640  ORF Transcript_4354/g.9640 Transcript_4354/m.9640 type:complete len:549 (-) Transcript_4354:67-1713(-)